MVSGQDRCPNGWNEDVSGRAERAQVGVRQWQSADSFFPPPSSPSVYAGAILKDESASLASFGLVNGSKITLMGSKPDVSG